MTEIAKLDPKTSAVLALDCQKGSAPTTSSKKCSELKAALRAVLDRRRFSS
jgi:hypothetical protein